MARRSAAIFCVALVFLSWAGFGRAEEVKVVITGQAFGALYPCACPKAPDGGVARRAAAIEAIRATTKNVIVLESGLSFASGSQDQYAQNMELDRQRTEIYLKALERMKYDALLVSSQELVFGPGFLRGMKMPFVSSNAEGLGAPYIIKEVAGQKIGILGVTDALAQSRGVSGWHLPAEALNRQIADLKNQGVSYIILMGVMTPQDDRDFLKKVKGVDLFVDGRVSYGTPASQEIGGVLTVGTWWQAKKLAVLTLDVDGGKMVARGFESVALDGAVPDDAAVAALLPACFQDDDCQRTAGAFARCQDAGTRQARCRAPQKTVIGVTVIRPAACRVCDVQKTMDLTLGELRKIFGDLKVTYVSEEDPWAKDFLSSQWKTSYLPVYLFDKAVAKADVFAKLGSIFDEVNDFYVLEQESAGVSYLYGRPRIPRRVDVIWDQRYSSSAALFRLFKEFRGRHPDYDIQIHFLSRGAADRGLFVPVGSAFEIEELKRVACVDATAHDRLLDYLICRNEQAESSWWDECFEKTRLETKKIKACSQGSEGQAQMQAHLNLSGSLEITTGPTIIVENKEIFFVRNVPSVEEIEKIIIADNQKAVGQK